MQVIHTFGVLDVETTGLDPSVDQIIDFGLLVVEYIQDSKGKLIREIGRYEGKREPGFPIPKAATKVNGIKDRDVKGKTLDIEYILQLLSRCEFLVAHNVVFDKGFVNKLIPESRKLSWLCSMKGIDWRSKGHSGRSLGALAKYYRTKVQPDHSALSDAAAVSCLLMVQYDGIPLLEELIDNSENWLPQIVVDRNNGIFEQQEEALKEIATTEEMFKPSEPHRSTSLWKVLGWVLIPYIMLPFQWRKMERGRKFLGVAWTLFVVIYILSR